MKVLAITLIGMSAGNAEATTSLLYQHDEATLSCSTSAICGNHRATHQVKVYENGTQRLLYWNQNVPSSTPNPDIYTAYTIGGACAAGDPVANMTAEWELLSSGRPVKATVTMCDGVTQAEYSVSMPINSYDPDKDDGGCVRLPWGYVCNY